MFKILIFLVLIIPGLDTELTELEQKLDKLWSFSGRFPENGDMEVDLTKMIASYEESKGSLEKEKEESIAQYKGLAKQVAELIFAKLIKLLEVALESIEKDKETAIETEKGSKVFAAEGNKLWTAFRATMIEASKKDTKITFATLICYLKEFPNKMVAIFKDNKKLGDAVKYCFETPFASIAELLEKEKGKAAESCPLTESTTSPLEYKSGLLPILKAVENLQDH